MYAGYIALIVLPFIILISGIIVAIKTKKNEEFPPISMSILIIGIIVILICITVVPVFRMDAKQKLAEFEGTRDLCEQLIKDGEYNENIGLTSTIIDVNRWLVQAQSSIKTWGYNSSYYGLGIEDLKPITIR